MNEDAVHFCEYPMTPENTELLALTADIVSAHVGNNTVAVTDLPTLITKIYTALASLGEPAPAKPAEKQEPAVSIRASVKPDYLVCLEDGQKLKVLKRHLMVHHQMTPDAYRAKWSLPNDYPLVAPAYREHRQAQAIKIGLGKKALDETPAPAPEAEQEAAPEAATPAPARTRRPKLKLVL